MAQDNRLIQEFQQNSLVFDIGVATGPGGGVSLSGLYGGIMPYRQAPLGGLSDALAAISGVGGPGEADKVNKHPINRVCVFENEIHNLAQGLWTKQDEITGSWDTVIDLNNYNIDTVYNHIGLYPVFNQVTNKRYLVTAYFTSIGTGRWIAIAYNKDDDVVTSGTLTPSQLSGYTVDLSPQDCQLGNNIYFTGSNSPGRLMILNGLNLDITGMSLAGVERPVDLCAYSGNVYVAYKDTTVAGVNGSGVVTVGKVDAGLIRPVLHLPFEDLPASHPSNPELGYAVTDTSASVPRQKCLLFVDNNPATADSDPAMWLYYQNSPQKTPSGLTDTALTGYGIYGYSVWKLKGDGAGGLTVLYQNDVMMSQYRSGSAEGLIPLGNADHAVISYCDNYPGWFITSPEKSFLTLRPFGGEPGQTFLQWDFDPDNPPTLGGATQGGPAKVSFSQDKLGGGSRWSPAATSTTTALDVNIFDIAYTSGHFVDANRDTWRIHFKLMPSTAYHAGYSGIAGAGMSVRWYYDKHHAPNKRCTLASPGNSSHGTVTNNQINGLTISSGVDYWVDWDFSANSFNAGDKLYLCGLLFDPNNSSIPPLGL